MSLLLFGLKNDLLKIMSCGAIVTATVLENTGIVMKCFKILVRNAQVKILLKTLSAETANWKFEFDDDIVATKKSKGDQTMGRLYKINPPCPKCHEEHNWWHIQLTDEEQAKMDEYVAASAEKSSMELLLGEPGIVITRKLKCCCCGHVFIVEAGLRKFDEVGYRDQDFIAAVGEIPV